MRRNIALVTILVFVLGLLLTAAYAAGTCSMSGQGKACSSVSKQGCCPKANATSDAKVKCADKCAQNKDCKSCKDSCKNCKNCKDGCKNCCKATSTANSSKVSGTATCSMNKANCPKQGRTAQATKKCGSCSKTQQAVKQTVKK